MFIFNFVYTKHQVLLICNENKEFLLPIWWYNRGLFPLGNKYLGVFILNGLKEIQLIRQCVMLSIAVVLLPIASFRRACRCGGSMSTGTCLIWKRCGWRTSSPQRNSCSQSPACKTPSPSVVRSCAGRWLQRRKTNPWAWRDQADWCVLKPSEKLIAALKWEFVIPFVLLLFDFAS